MHESDWLALISPPVGVAVAALTGGVLGLLGAWALGAARRGRLASLLREAGKRGGDLEGQVERRTAELAEVSASLAAEIAERRAAEARLRNSEGQVRALLDAAPFAMMVSRFPEGEALSMNRPCRDLLRFESEAAAAGFSTRDLYADPADRPAILAQLNETGMVQGVELRVWTHGGEPAWVLLSGARLVLGEVDALIFCMIDIGESKQVEDTLRRANRRAEAALEAGRRAMREQRNFLSMVSHEFRMPLAIVKGAADVLGLVAGGRTEAEEELAKIGRAVRRMSDLIDVCLADDRLNSAELALKSEVVDLARLAAELGEEIGAYAPTRRLSIEAPAAVPVLGDVALLRVALSNLIDNALKFSPAAAPVTMRVELDPDLATVRVIDQGPGFAAEDLPRIFEKFFRSTKADRVRGAGLGLYLVRRIAELHHGGVAVESPPGAGGVVALWLPRRRAADAPAVPQDLA